MLKRVISQHLTALFMAGVVVLNFPLLMLWDQDIRVFGLPLLPAGLFLLWAILIVLLARIMESSGD
jgi:hypothetical protein